MSDPVDSVNAIARLFDGMAEARRKQNDEQSALQHDQRAAQLRELISETKALRRWKMPVPASYGDISDLPDELVSQLSGIKTDELEEQIYGVVKAAGAEIELDRLLIELFRRFGSVHERRFINNKCYRMAQKGLIFQVPGRKGVYTTLKPEVATYDDEEDEPEVEPAKATDFSNLDDEIPF